MKNMTTHQNEFNPGKNQDKGTSCPASTLFSGVSFSMGVNVAATLGEVAKINTKAAARAVNQSKFAHDTLNYIAGYRGRIIRAQMTRGGN